jgi:divalent metal cation (Fe/Co/Zn/Cd) transporter
MLIGQSADPNVNAAIKGFLEQRPDVARVFSLITLQLGNDLMVAVKAQLHQSSAAKEDVINAIERELKSQFPQVKWSFFEPDNTA